MATAKDLDTNQTTNYIKYNTTEKHHLYSHFETVVVDVESIRALLISILAAIKTYHTERAIKLANIGK